LRAAGCRAGYDAVRRYVSRRLGRAGRPGPRTGECKPDPPAPPSPRKLSFEFIRRAEEREGAEQARLDKLREADAGLREALDLGAEFAAMVRKQVAVPLAEWLAKAEESGCDELRGFAAGLRLERTGRRPGPGAAHVQVVFKAQGPIYVVHSEVETQLFAGEADVGVVGHGSLLGPVTPGMAWSVLRRPFRS
jgi:hypothetical protein